MTLVIVTHDPDLAMHCKRIIHILDGKVNDDERLDRSVGYPVQLPDLVMVEKRTR
jgi:ABC-type lipoprotein export system ATPase subunit